MSYPLNMGRRDFLTSAGRLATGAAALSLFAPTRAHAVAQKGGHLRAALTGGATTDTLDPAVVVDPFLYSINWALRNNLTEIAPDGSLVGELAESWESSPDAKTWIFTLRKGVEFHNGKSLTADDVVQSFNHHRGEKSRSVAKPIVIQIVDITIDERNKIRFELAGGNADWPYLVSDFHLPILPYQDGKLDISGVGSGGYVLERFNPGVDAAFTRFKNYWKQDRAHFDSSELLNVPDDVARTNALISGAVDVMSTLDLKTASQLDRTDRVRVIETNGTMHVDFPMLTDTPPFTDNNVRLAFKHAVDREKILEQVLFGRGTLGNDHPIAPINRYYAKDIPQRPYDPDKAKFYLKKAGLENVTVNLSASDGVLAGSVAAATIYQNSAAEAGITINLVREPADGYWDNVYIKKPFITTPWGGAANRGLDVLNSLCFHRYLERHPLEE